MLFIRLSKKMEIILKTAITTALAASVIVFSTGPVAFAHNSKLTTVYNVYLNHTYIGTVTDKNVVEKEIAAQIDNIKKSYKNVDITVNPTIEYIEKQDLHSTANNQEAIQNIDNAIVQNTETTPAAIVVDGKPVVYLNSIKTANDVMKKLKLKYVSEEQLNELDARKVSPNTALPPLKENETRLVDVRFSEKVSINDEKTTPVKIMSEEEAIVFLQKGTIEEKKYAVQQGDVLGSIANNNGLKLSELKALNPGLDENSVLKIGQEVNITALKPLLHVMIEKESYQKEDLPFKEEVIEDSSMPKGDTKEKQAGINGTRIVTYHIFDQNGVTTNKEVANEQILVQPVNHVVIKGTKAIPSRGEGSFVWPTNGGYISSGVGYRWGKMHKGIDIARPSDLTIKAADNGIVVFAGWGGAFGNKVVIDHQNGFQTIYGHLSSIGVQVSQVVPVGTTIGIMGATGDATGVHLHFEIWKNGALQNPVDYLR
ncbi:peptidoglycan DD-metalloendopeptidase family protein [Neobacillus massiliamazoniensis]|uniref:Peptidase M23 n=1 Tax=Neobacillus massiliamazoniensis TaxID=1499688 RepID=A0A0U1NX75_9BACI|nr:M23 family metallopeptidase [Neobacillus massiliamazoniensis]CRK82468.1 peptidase M23 [Neobacillus massiliamazoniensis]